MDLIKLIFKRDWVLWEHFLRINENEIVTQNELIESMAEKVKERIVNKLKCD
jgi:hypothetical protein